MKKENDILTVQNQEFIVSLEAKKILNKYLIDIGKKYRLDKNAKKELETALRDILTEIISTKKKTSVSEKTAQEAVKMIGDSFEGHGNLDKIKSAIISTASTIGKKIKKAVITETFRRRMYYTLALISLLPLGIQVSLLPVLQPDFINSPTVGYTAYESTLGTVTLGDYANSAFNPARSSVDVLVNNTPAIASIIVVFALVTLMLIGLAQKSKHLKLLFGTLILSVVLSFSINQNNEMVFQDAIRFNTGFNTSTELISREANDYDTLSACGSSINYIELNNSAGDIYYSLKDQGFTLAHKFDGEGIDYTPTRDKLCGAYNELRNKLPDESIVLQTFMIDIDGIERPVDLEERYGLRGTAGKKKYFKIYYGFFTKTSN